MTSLAKNPRAYPLHCSVHNLYNSLQSSQPTYTSTNSSPSSQPALLDHHPVSPFLDPRSLLISCSPTEPYPSLHHVFWNDLPPELRTISLPPPPSLPITTHPPPLSIPPGRAFHSKLKCHLFKLSYPDPSDHSSPPPERHPP